MNKKLTANRDRSPVVAQARHQPFGRPQSINPSIHQSTPPLRVGAFEPRSLVNGPGVRAVLWVQGCGRRCPGCFNPEFLPREGGRTVSVKQVIHWIRAALAATYPPHPPSSIPHPPSSSTPHPSTLHPPSPIPHPPSPLEGVTFSGGEPFDHAAALAAVARAARAMGLGVLVFTGHPWEELQRSTDPAHRALLAATDLLIAGPYERGPTPHHPSSILHHPPSIIHHASSTHPLLSSANQRLVFLTERYRRHDFGRQRRLEFRIAPDGTVRTTGFPHQSINPSIHQSPHPPVHHPSSIVHHPPIPQSPNPPIPQSINPLIPLSPPYDY